MRGNCIFDFAQTFTHQKSSIVKYTERGGDTERERVRNRKIKQERKIERKYRTTIWLD